MPWINGSKWTCIAAALLLAGCVSATAITVAPLCGETAAKAPIKPVCISKDDALTEKTASQIEGNNLALTKLCKVKVDCKKQKQKPKPI